MGKVLMSELETTVTPDSSCQACQKKIGLLPEYLLCLVLCSVRLGQVRCMQVSARPIKPRSSTFLAAPRILPLVLTFTQSLRSTPIQSLDEALKDVASNGARLVAFDGLLSLPATAPGLDRAALDLPPFEEKGKEIVFLRKVVVGRALSPFAWRTSHVKEMRLSSTDTPAPGWGVVSDPSKGTGFIHLPATLTSATLEDGALELARRQQAEGGRRFTSAALGTVGFFYPFQHQVDDRILRAGTPVRVFGRLNVQGQVEAQRHAWWRLNPHPTPLVLTRPGAEADVINAHQDAATLYRLVAAGTLLPGLALLGWAYRT